ncbi:PRC-barrel domain-containing protein [Candidatus Micrarchaeota archaeon]|nr:PRC-barrel domain-containing protein [Candidatus Micrarchaeota archaeon]
MAKTILGKNLRGRKVVSKNGSELGFVVDAYFDNSGKINSLMVQPEREDREFKDHLDKNGFIPVPYESVRAIGKYVIVDFPTR